MADLAIDRPANPPRARVFDGLFQGATWFFAVFILLLLAAVLASLVVGALPALRKFGWGFVVSSSWNPVTEQFGALPAIAGTLITSSIAMLIGIPVAFGIALFITELCPPVLRRPIGVLIELLAAIPSIIYGIWGLFVFAPMFQQTVEPVLNDVFGDVPIVGALLSGPPIGIGMLTAGLILSIMVIPFIAAVMRDVFELVPPLLKESAYGLGSTTWEVVWRVVLPYTKVGVIGGVMLGLGRALGETMAVTFVIGNAHQLAVSLMAPGNSIASALANEFTEAVGDLYTSSLVALGALLFLITFSVIAAARYMLLRLERRALSSV